VLSEEKKYKKRSNLLQKMKKERIIGVQGSTAHVLGFGAANCSPEKNVLVKEM